MIPLVSARGVALRALVSLHRQRGRRLRTELEGCGLQGRDLAFAYELAHGVIRRERLLDHVIAGLAHRGIPKHPLLLSALRLGVYQLLFMPGMPAHAAVHETVSLIRNNRGFANALLRRAAGMVRSRGADADRPREELWLSDHRALMLPKPLPPGQADRLAVLHSMPAWLAQRFCDQHGEQGFGQIAQAASTKPAIHLRCRGAAEELRARLQAEGVEVELSRDPRMLRWVGGVSPFATRSFLGGDFVAQDPTALAAASALPCRDGDQVIDLCAAPGTKTTFLAEQVGASGRVFACDPDAARRERVVENVQRLQLGDVVEVVVDPAGLEPADCVLADVPCSNTGVLGRRVEVRGRLTPETFNELAALQQEIFTRAVTLTKPGGHLVYSTCSVDREENEAVVAAVMNSGF